jgi:hypothetical protein
MAAGDAGDFPAGPGFATMRAPRDRAPHNQHTRRQPMDNIRAGRTAPIRTLAGPPPVGETA